MALLLQVLANGILLGGLYALMALGLALVWGVILVLDLTASEPNARLVAGQGIPSVSEIRFAWKQKQLLMADLAFALEPAPAGKSSPAPPGPHSDRQTDNLNT